MKSGRNYISPYTASSFKEYLSESSLTLATCWKLVSKTNQIVGATSHTRDLELASHLGITFKSTQGVVPSAADNEIGLGSAGLEVDSVFSVDVLTEETVAAGDWDGAYFEVFLVNYTDFNMGELVMFAGTIGEVKTYGERFKAEGRPLTSKSTQQVGNIHTEKCTVRRLGDNRCKTSVIIGAVAAGDGGVVTTTGTVTTGGSNIQFNDSSRGETTGYYTHGTVTFTSGALSGRSSEVIQHIGTSPQSGGNTLRWATDSSWKVNATNPSGWSTAGFDDNSWINATEQGRHSVAPWIHPVANFPADSNAQWIWRFFSVNVPDTVGLSTYYRKTFTPNVSSAVIKIAGDDTYTLYVNNVQLNTSSSWNIAQSYNITLNPNVVNVIAVHVQNNAGPANQNNPGGLIADITFATFSPTPTTGSLIQLSIPMPRVIDVGTTYTITRGCNREWTTCKNVFNNLLNFRGFPFVPGIEKAYKVNR